MRHDLTFVGLRAVRQVLHEVILFAFELHVRTGWLRVALRDTPQRATFGTEGLLQGGEVREDDDGEVLEGGVQQSGLSELRVGVDEQYDEEFDLCGFE